MNEKVRAVLDGVIERFRTGDVPEAVAMAMFPVADVPSAKWSLLNRTLMFLSGTQDARGFRQWQQANRHVKKGSKAFHILVPYFKKKTDEGTGEEAQFLSGFGCKPVFRVEDTDGDHLDYEKLEVPTLPLIEKAEEWGLSVKAVPGNYRYYGYYSPSRKQIALASEEEAVFFHELAHAGHEKLNGSLRPGQDPLQEIVAELSAQALCKMVGKQANDTMGNSYRYIEGYAKKVNLSPHAACLKVMAETEKVLGLILGTG
ncbi:ArdC-like ssDNA-binding domain-containing protein [Desulfatibacillum aliphaticivorans]|uniref:ArdC-like ssDNA-binding domain-containing protein n=1 Tax=Desulfatibacillum aliphaticivorans TaxID=218208 RepID=UPI0003F75047|nr:antirestriction protein [Desulfatibacillum aliphaticivorans]